MRIAFADENTYSDQDLPFAFISASSSSARFLYSRKFSSIMKNARAPSVRSAPAIARYTSSPRSRKVTDLPLPPKNSDVVQKLQPIGQPTDERIVAAALRPLPGMGTPISRNPNDEGMTG